MRYIYLQLIVLCALVSSCCANKAEEVNANKADSIQVDMMAHQIWYDLNVKIGNGDTCSFTPYQKQVYDVTYGKMAGKVKKVEGKKQLHLEMTKDEYMKFGLHEAFYNAMVKDLEGVNHYFDSIPNDTVMWNEYVKFYKLIE